MNLFAYEINQYLATNISGLTFGVGDTILKVGELSLDKEGIYAIESATTKPETYTPIEYAHIDFWSRYKNTKDGYIQLDLIKNKLNRAFYYQTTDFLVYYSSATSNIEDQDKDISGCKLFRLGVDFMYRNTNLIS